jgi:hypothetical protein
MATSTKGVEQTVAALGRMTLGQLREKYLELFGEPTRSGNRDFLFKRLAWRVQSLAEGTLSQRARRRAEELARDADIRTTLPRPPKHAAVAATTVAPPAPKETAQDRLPIAGTVLTRKYRGKHVETKVLAYGFEYEGQVYRSLSAVAKAVTGSHWNGHLFFGLTTKVKR